jgi:hypothetical protein
MHKKVNFWFTVVLIVALLAAITAGTYAWFIANTGEAEDIDFEVRAGQATMIFLKPLVDPVVENGEPVNNILRPAIAKADALAHNKLGDPLGEPDEYLAEPATVVVYESSFMVYTGDIVAVDVLLKAKATIAGVSTRPDACLIVSGELAVKVEVYDRSLAEDDQLLFTVANDDLAKGELLKVNPETKLELVITMYLARWDVAASPDLKNTMLDFTLFLSIETDDN